MKNIFVITISLILLTVGTALADTPKKPAALGNKETDQETLNEALNWVEKSYQNLIDHQWAEAIRTSSVAISINPSLTSAYINRSAAYIEKELFEEAIEDCTKAIEIDKKSSAAFNNRGLAYFKAGETDLSVRDYRRACTLGSARGCENFKNQTGYSPSEEGNFLFNQSIEALSTGNFHLANELSTQVLEIEPNNANALSNRCVSRANLGLLDEAEKDCEEAIKINHDIAATYNNYAFVLEKKGVSKQASIYYEVSCGLGSKVGCENYKRLTKLILTSP
jgi:tetratricopeptide (TPR) repeat protein